MTSSCESIIETLVVEDGIDSCDDEQTLLKLKDK